MARPLTPQISPDEVFRTALAILDEQGIDGLTVRHLAERLNVRNGSLYYHFLGKDDIVAGAAQLALTGVGVPPKDGEPWGSWLVRNACAYRQRLLEHPALISVMHDGGRFRFVLSWFDQIAAGLDAQGVPTTATLALIETLDELVMGSVMAECSARQFEKAPVGPEFPHLRSAIRDRVLTHQERFELSCRHLIEGLAESLGLDVQVESAGDVR